jgi:hypothetical protein
MRALVVEESMFGNTESVAEAIAEGLASAGAEVEVRPVREAGPDVSGVDLLVVGGPTHAFSLSRPSTREDAATKGADDDAAAGIGLREWIEAVEPAAGVDVATFDTKVRHPKLPGSAARAARKRLRAKGFHALDPATTFWVEGTDGPLVAGELDRARQWATELVEAKLVG